MDIVPVRGRAALVCVFGQCKWSVLPSPVSKLYGAGRLFACRHCYRLAYASQQESAHQRGLGKSQKVRMRMHWRTCER